MMIFNYDKFNIKNIIEKDNKKFLITNVDKIHFLFEGGVEFESEFGSIFYGPEENTYLIVLDKQYENLRDITKDFVINHEIGHVVFNIASEYGEDNIEPEIQVDKRLGYTKDDLLFIYTDLFLNTSNKLIKEHLKLRMKRIKEVL